LSDFHVAFPHDARKLGFDPDGYVTIEAPNVQAARAAAFLIFKSHWAIIYEPHELKPEYFPNGEVDRITVAANGMRLDGK
jgi:hypothetical protein